MVLERKFRIQAQAFREQKITNAIFKRLFGFVVLLSIVLDLFYTGYLRDKRAPDTQHDIPHNDQEIIDNSPKRELKSIVEQNVAVHPNQPEMTKIEDTTPMRKRPTLSRTNSRVIKTADKPVVQHNPPVNPPEQPSPEDETRSVSPADDSSNEEISDQTEVDELAKVDEMRKQIIRFHDHHQSLTKQELDQLAVSIITNVLQLKDQKEVHGEEFKKGTWEDVAYRSIVQVMWNNDALCNGYASYADLTEKQKQGIILELWGLIQKNKAAIEQIKENYYGIAVVYAGEADKDVSMFGGMEFPLLTKDVIASNRAMYELLKRREGLCGAWDFDDLEHCHKKMDERFKKDGGYVAYNQLSAQEQEKYRQEMGQYLQNLMDQRLLDQKNSKVRGMHAPTSRDTGNTQVDSTLEHAESVSPKELGKVLVPNLFKV